MTLALPPVRFLANGRYTVMLNATGSGFSKYGYFALNRWSGDFVEDREGYFCYLRDCEDGRCWSAGIQPTRSPAESYRIIDEPGCFCLQRRDHGIETRFKVCVPPDADLEIRRVTLRNTTDRPRLIEVTSFLDVVLNHPAAHAAHPAFSKLFVQTECLAEQQVLLVRRRPRAAGEFSPWLINAVCGPGEWQFDTDRARFVGRGHDYAAPRALCVREPLAQTVGNVLDPALVLRKIVTIPPGDGVELHFILGAADSRAAAIALLQRGRSGLDFASAVQAAAGRECELQRQYGLTDAQAWHLQTLAGAMATGRPELGAPADVRRRAAGSVYLAGAYGMPADRPFAVVTAADGATEAVVRSVQAQRYWHGLGLDTALLVLTDAEAGGDTADGSIVYRRRADVPPDLMDILLATARLVVGERFPELQRTLPPAPTLDATVAETDRAACLSTPPLRCANGYGGFTDDGAEYVIRLDSEPDRLRLPPLPWINVIANEQFGCLISETGAGYTWARNSREYRLTPWSNDPLLDPHGEALYLRDDDSGAVWSPWPGPRPAAAPYETRHGFGYTRCSHLSHELLQETAVFVARHDPVKFNRLALTNRSRTRRRLSVYCYQRLVLGSTPADSSRFVVTTPDPVNRLLLAVNRLAGEFGDDIAFAAVIPADAGSWHCTGDRERCLGPGNGPERPAAILRGEPLDGRGGPGLDPCSVQQIPIELEPGETRVLTFLLGGTTAEADARRLVEQYRQPGAVDRALAEVTAFWRERLTALRVTTPSPAIDLMVNGWLTYQNLACRLWARSAFYQSGGAFGYRDQLQDAAALLYLWPELTRRQILLHAAHQFVEGDVLHWWHAEPLERGLRTRFADDRNWLPYVVALYVKTTGDWSILDEQAPFVTARLLADGEDEAYLKPDPAGDSADVYEHCCRALDCSLTRGAHDLPLMGTGDWNDGMNRVGREGRGESVWMGFFLYHILSEFLPLCEQRGDTERVYRYARYRNELYGPLNGPGWDGHWYRRAYYDDGSPLGSHQNDECRIDALAQAWAVIAGAAPAERAVRAMAAVERYLIAEADGIIRLLTPPFADTPLDPGYIKGYVAGVRENGGQYTHAACWVVKALAELGRHERAAKLLEMLSPVSHTLTPEQVERYQLEPYVVAADVYGAPPHVGRGGWSWYTGSAGWLYRVAVESVLGLRLENGCTLVLKPCIPPDWPGFQIDYRLADGTTRLIIDVKNPRQGGRRVASAQMDGRPLTVANGAARVPLRPDGAEHRVEVVLLSEPQIAAN